MLPIFYTFFSNMVKVVRMEVESLVLKAGWAELGKALEGGLCCTNAWQQELSPKTLQTPHPRTKAPRTSQGLCCTNALTTRAKDPTDTTSTHKSPGDLSQKAPLWGHLPSTCLSNLTPAPPLLWALVGKDNCLQTTYVFFKNSLSSLISLNVFTDSHCNGQFPNKYSFLQRVFLSLI